MLAALLSAALLASASATEAVQKPSLKSLKKAFHEENFKRIRAAGVPMKEVVAPQGSSGLEWVQLYAEQGNTCTGTATSNSYFVVNSCLAVNGGTSEMQTAVMLDNGDYNVTSMYYSDDACTTQTASVMMTWSGSCDSPTLSSGYAYYVEGTSSSFSQPSNTMGTLAYNSETDCTNGKDNTVISATFTFLDQCYNSGTYSYKVTSCNSVKYYTQNDCKGNAYNYDDDIYGDDDDDDDDDSSLSTLCYEGSTANGATTEYEKYSCKSAAASVASASGVAMLAATALAAFAML